MTAHILLQDPKYPHNVGGALRAASCFGADVVWYTGTRLNEQIRGMKRLPREERMRNYGRTRLNSAPEARVLETIDIHYPDLVPVCVEIMPGAESLPWFKHPDNAIYVFGPEDGSVTTGMRAACHRFVSIPTFHCVNLAAAVYLVLYDRITKNDDHKYYNNTGQIGWFNHEELGSSVV